MRILVVILLSIFVLAGCSPLTSGENSFQTGDYKASMHDLLPIARKGNADAQYAVGYMYYKGLGVKRDYDMALYWFHKAAAQDQPSAVTAMKMIARAKNSQLFAAPRGIKNFQGKTIS